MELLNEIDWAYNIPDKAKFIENQSNFKNSAIHRITNNTFYSPLSKVANNETVAKIKKTPTKTTKPIVSVPNKLEKTGYIPGLRRPPLFPHSSNLTPEQHEICIRALKSMNDYCFTMPKTKNSNNDLQIYNNLIPIINEEQNLFMEYVKNNWNTKECGRHLRMDAEHENIIINIWRKKINLFKNYPRFYEMATMIPLVYSNTEVPIELVLLKSIEDTDTIPILKNLILTSRYILPVNRKELNDKINDITNICKRPTVSQDVKCEKYALEYRAHIVISDNALQTLADNNPPFSQTWNLPVLIKGYNTFDDKGNKIIHKVTFIDHALPSTNLTEHQKALWFFNLLTKSNFVRRPKCDKKDETNTNTCDGCKKFALNFSKVNNENIVRPSSPSANMSDDSDDEKLIIDSPTIESPTSQPDSPSRIMTRSFVKSNQQQSKSPTITQNTKKNPVYDQHCTCDNKIVEKYYDYENVSALAEKILSNLNKTDNEYEDVTQNTYKLWKIGQSKEKIKFCKDISPDITVLVRSKIDACDLNEDGTRQMYVIAPKLEYQWEFGAEIITPSEAVHQWTSLKFSPESKLLRARLLPNTREICMIEKVPLQPFTGEILKRTSWKPEHGLGCYFNVFSKLSMLQPGQYILRHEPKHHAFALLFSSIEERRPNCLDLEEIYKNPETFIINQSAPWIPIDPTVVTPNLYHYKTMPCMFTPGNCKLKIIPEKQDNKKNTKKAKKNKKKGKINKKYGKFIAKGQNTNQPKIKIVQDD